MCLTCEWFAFASPSPSTCAVLRWSTIHCTVLYWNASALARGSQVHTDKAHVMEAHPSDPRVVMTSGYDGLTVLWDIFAGASLAV